MGAASDGQYQDGAWAIQRVTGADLLAAGLQEVFVAGSVTPSGQRNTEKMVPTDTLTSMFELPSSGSNSSR